MTAEMIDKLTDQDLKEHVMLYKEHANNIREKIVLDMLLETTIERNLNL